MEVTDPDELLTLAEVAAELAGRGADRPRCRQERRAGARDAGHRTRRPTSQPTTDPDQQLAKALQHPAARLQFAFVEDDAELRRAIEDEDFKAWRVFLHPEQRRYAERSWKGPFRLSGGAGTGKTVVLLHRARNLARRDPGARILLTTFNRTLADALQRDLKVLDPDPARGRSHRGGGSPRARGRRRRARRPPGQPGRGSGGGRQPCSGSRTSEIG